MRESVITNLGPELAEGIVEGSSKEDLEQLKDGVRNGVEHGDWGGIIEHRMYDYRIVGWRLIVSTAKLENPSMLQVHSTGLVNPKTQCE